MARDLVARGHRVVLLGRDPRKGQQALASFGYAGGSASFIPVDLSAHAGLRQAAQRVLAENEYLDALLHTAEVMTLNETSSARSPGTSARWRRRDPGRRAQAAGGDRGHRVVAAHPGSPGPPAVRLPVSPPRGGVRTAGVICRKEPRWCRAPPRSRGELLVISRLAVRMAGLGRRGRGLLWGPGSRGVPDRPS
ncbi:SDR family NAD(P)-dependent oxidoreductase [Nonomuraea sp. NPDC050153]|uniref:SDR family NAD(P)-dependent oxidoreductase n=1 Tax=Nonomuraea sp. NPDC050153 TaxID=3364359 RepID=UPI00378DE88A